MRRKKTDKKIQERDEKELKNWGEREMNLWIIQKKKSRLIERINAQSGLRLQLEFFI